MTPAAIICEAAADGVILALSPADTIKATGDQVAVTRWLPVLREHKPDILPALAKPDPLHPSPQPPNPAARSSSTSSPATAPVTPSTSRTPTPIRWSWP
jgi:hypothetical protein